MANSTVTKRKLSITKDLVWKVKGSNPSTGKLFSLEIFVPPVSMAPRLLAIMCGSEPFKNKKGPGFGPKFKKSASPHYLSKR